MAVPVEPHPRLITSDYWQGVDIANPDHFKTVTSNEGLPVGIMVLRNATKSFLGRISVLVHEQGHEERVFTQWFEPTADTLCDGSLVIIERESLVTEHEGDQGVLRDLSIKATNQQSFPITSPFSSNWIDAQIAGFHDCGVEHALFEEQGILYIRSLMWGILLTNKRGERGVATWAFHDPSIIDLETGEVEITQPDDEVEELPLEIGVPRPELILDETGVVMRSIERNKSVNIVRHTSPEGGGPTRRKQRLPLSERLLNLLPKRPLSTRPVITS